MFSVLSRLTKPGDGKKFNTPSPMSTSLQKKFARGVDYNMKILIKGDRNVGKSCLLQRLQGGTFIEEYHPTDQIQVAPIHWKYKDTDHIIKVEVWEVVDKGRVKRKGPAGLKFDNSSIVDAIETPALDATFLDVYVNANGVIMMMDITKTWTFEYIKREIETVPSELPVIILGNHCDMHHHREVDSYQIEIFMATVRQTRAGPLRYAESSMRNGFGLRLLHTFFNIPFLKLQRQTLLNQLAVNDQEILDAHKELDEFEKSDGADYDAFLDRLVSKRNASDNSIGGVHIATDKSPSIVLGAGKPIIPPNVNPLAQANLTAQSRSSLEQRQTLKTNLNKMPPGKSEKTNKNQEQNVQNHLKSAHLTSVEASNKSKDDLEDFCAGVLDHSFLDDYSPTSKSSGTAVPIPNNVFHKQNVDSESDGDIGANPLVVGIQDDVDSAEDDNDGNIKNVTQLETSTARIKLKPSENFDVNTEQQFPRPISKFTPYNETIINGIQSNYNENSDKLENMNTFQPYSNRDADDDQYDSGPEFGQPPGYDSMPSWSLDVSVRRSPEGGEGVSPSSEVKKQNKNKDEKKHKKSKKLSKDSEKSNKKDKVKDKDKKLKEKKHKKRGSDEHLEDFLSGGVKIDQTEGTYEVL